MLRLYWQLTGQLEAVPTAAERFPARPWLDKPTPEKGLIEQVRSQLKQLESVESIHYEHAWSLDGDSTVYTAHLLMNSPMDSSAQLQAKAQIAKILDQFKFLHTTIELEFPEENCRDEK